MTASFVALAADRVVCTCTHLQPHKPYAPVPMPLVAALSQDLGQGVAVGGRTVALGGSQGLNSPRHRCRDHPDNIGRIEVGSTSVRVGGRPLARLGDPCSSCNVDGRRITGAVAPVGSRHVRVGDTAPKVAPLFAEPLSLVSKSPPALRGWPGPPAGVCSSVSFESPKARFMGLLYEVTVTISGEVTLSTDADGQCLVGTSWAKGRAPVLKAWVRDMNAASYSVSEVSADSASIAVGVLQGKVELGVRLEPPPIWWTHPAVMPTFFARFPLTPEVGEDRIRSTLSCEVTWRPNYLRMQLAAVGVAVGVVVFIYGGEIVAAGAALVGRASLPRAIAASLRLMVPAGGLSLVALLTAELTLVAADLHKSLLAPIPET